MWGRREWEFSGKLEGSLLWVDGKFEFASFLTVA
jgi:hypothetical protein